MTSIPPQPGPAVPVVTRDGVEWVAPEHPTVWLGSLQSESVKALQAYLSRVGLYDDQWGDEPGTFGQVTDAAVRAFQTQAGINPNGIVDDVTWLNLDSWEGTQRVENYD